MPTTKPHSPYILTECFDLKAPIVPNYKKPRGRENWQQASAGQNYGTRGDGLTDRKTRAATHSTGSFDHESVHCR